MPEGPEIKKAVDFLNNILKESNTITSFEFLDGRYLKKKLPGLHVLSFSIDFLYINHCIYNQE